MHKIDVEAHEYAKDKGKFRHLLENAYALGAYNTVKKFLK